MQIISDITKEELMENSDPLGMACFPLDKIKMLADFFWCLDKDEFETGNVFNHGNMITMHEVLKDSCKEINFLIDVSSNQYRNLRVRKQKLENVLKTFITYLEDQGDKPDMKTMAAKLRKQMGGAQ